MGELTLLTYTLSDTWQFNDYNGALFNSKFILASYYGSTV